VNVLVLDGKVGLTELDEEILQTFFDIKEKCIILMNKTDKLKQKDVSKNLKKLKEKVGMRAQVIIFSATRKKGIKEF
jgi:GTP-binding protein EngB required for normal cell division